MFPSSQFTNGNIGNAIELQTEGIAIGTGITINTTAPENTWVSYGPTGSGAVNTFAEMDEIPTGAKFVIVKITSKLSFTSGAGDSNKIYNLDVYARKNVSTEVTEGGTLITRIYVHTDTGGDGVDGDIVVTPIPLDSNLRFQMKWEHPLSTGAPSILVHVMGYII